MLSKPGLCLQLTSNEIEIVSLVICARHIVKPKPIVLFWSLFFLKALCYSGQNWIGNHNPNLTCNLYYTTNNLLLVEGHTVGKWFSVFEIDSFLGFD